MTSNAGDNPDDYRLRQLKQCSGTLFDGLEFHEAETGDSLALDRGVLFLMAFWSGPAVLGLNNLCRVLRDSERPPRFVLRVLDIDGASRPLIERLSKFPVRIGGNGEAYWFRKGEIIVATSAPTATDERIRELLEEITQDPES